MVNWKVLGGFALFGAVVSLLAGIAGGNPFGIILLRLLLSALLFGGLGFAVLYILRRFLPEVTAGSGRQAEGPAVDIVIDEEVDLGDRAAPEAEEELAEPIEEAEPAPAEAAAFVTDEQTAGAAFQQIAGAQLAEPEPEAELAAPEEERAAEDLEPAEPEAFSDESLDTLPDIERFSPGAASKGPSTLKRDFTESQVDSIKGQDPASLAKAVRTFLKRDQKG